MKNGTNARAVQPRIGTAEKNSDEARIRVSLNLDSPGSGYTSSISISKEEKALDPDTLEHMIAQVFRLADMEASITVEGDYTHHVWEDAMMALGRALRDALGSGKGIRRGASHFMIMEGVLVAVTIDIAGRGTASILLNNMNDGEQAAMAQHMLTAFATHGGFELGVFVLPLGEFAINSDHHKLETIGKALGMVLYDATRITRKGVPSTKGALSTVQ